MWSRVLQVWTRTPANQCPSQLFPSELQPGDKLFSFNYSKITNFRLFLQWTTLVGGSLRLVHRNCSKDQRWLKSSEVVIHSPIGHHNLNNELIGVDLTKTRENNYKSNFGSQHIYFIFVFISPESPHLSILSILKSTYLFLYPSSDYLKCFDTTNLKPLLSKADHHWSFKQFSNNSPRWITYQNTSQLIHKLFIRYIELNNICVNMYDFCKRYSIYLLYNIFLRGSTV